MTFHIISNFIVIVKYFLKKEGIATYPFFHYNYWLKTNRYETLKKYFSVHIYYVMFKLECQALFINLLNNFFQNFINIKITVNNNISFLYKKNNQISLVMEVFNENFYLSIKDKIII